MNNLENNENLDDLKENLMTEKLVCEFCGSNLKLKRFSQKMVLCDYCGNQNLLKKEEENNFKEKLSKAFSIFEKRPADPEKELRKKQKEEDRKIKTKQKLEKRAEKRETSLENKRIKQENKLDFFIANYINSPSSKVDREKFLMEYLSDKTDDIDLVIEKGPVEAGISEKVLRRVGEKLITDRTSKIHNLLLHKKQNNEICEEIIGEESERLCLALKLAQELIYLYGVKDINKINNDKLRSSLISYLQTMVEVPKVISRSKDIVDLFGILKFTSKKNGLKKKKNLKNKKGKRVLKPVKSTKVKNKLKSKNKIFNKENLMKGVDSALKFLNLSDIEDTVSFTITFTTTKPMATKLLNTLENINFHNNEEESKKDFKNEEKINKNTQIFEVSEDNYNIIEELDNFDKIKKLKEFYDMGILTEEEFEKKKKELLDL